MRDRALLYHRLLVAGVEQAKSVVAAPAPAGGAAEYLEYSMASKSALFDEFNSLSVVYSLPSTSFITQAPPYNTVGTGRKFPPQSSGFEEPPVSRPPPAAAAAAPAAAAVTSRAPSQPAAAALLDLDIGAPAAAPAPSLTLEAVSDLKPADFERIWLSAEVGAVIKEPLRRVPSVPEIEALLSKQGVCMMASSSPVNGVIRIFFHAREKTAAPVYHLIEVNLDVPNAIIGANFKSSQPAHVPDFAAIFRRTLFAAKLIEM